MYNKNTRWIEFKRKKPKLIYLVLLLLYLRLIMKPFTIFACSSILLFTAGCAQQTQQVPEISSNNMNPLCNIDNGMAGGWNTSIVTPDVEKATNYVIGMMNTSSKLKKILAVKTQVVAGTNYAIDFKLDNGQVWNTRVFRDLNGKFSMTQPAQQGSMNQDCNND